MPPPCDTNPIDIDEVHVIDTSAEAPREDGDTTMDMDDLIDDDAEKLPKNTTDEFGAFPGATTGITPTQWSALKRLHRGLAHPTERSLVRLLRRGRARTEVINSVPYLQCQVCDEIKSPKRRRHATAHRSTRLGERVLTDEFEVTLTDGYKVMIIAILDDASDMVMLVPTLAKSTVGANDIVIAIERHWLATFPIEKLVYDKTKAHESGLLEAMLQKHGVVPDELPGEAWWQKGKIEARIGFVKDHFMRLSHEVSLTKADDPWKWCGTLATAATVT